VIYGCGYVDPISLYNFPFFTHPNLAWIGFFKDDDMPLFNGRIFYNYEKYLS
jgi:hypothetical protein